MARKVEGAAGRLKKRRERKGVWSEVNGGTNRFDKLKALGDDADHDQQDEWEDMEEVEDDAVEHLPADAGANLVVVDHISHVPQPPTTEEDESDKIT